MQQGPSPIEGDNKPKKMPDSEFVCKLCDMIEVLFNWFSVILKSFAGAKMENNSW